jgi:membrane protease subunit HflK
VQQVLTDAHLVLLDTKGSNNLMYLPLDRLIRQSPASDVSRQPAASPPATSHEPPAPPTQRDVDRSRRTR